MERRCQNCKWYDAEGASSRRDDPDGIGLCGWPPDGLPYSMRYANRERTYVYAADGAACVAFIAGAAE